jgi:flagellar biosynthesis protein FlhB
MSDAADRTIPATPRRRELARRQGLAPQAHLPGWVAVLATTVLLLPAWARATLPAAAAMMRRAVVAATAAAPIEADLLLPVALVMPTVLVVAAAAAAGLAVRFLLDGSGWQLSRAAFRLDRIGIIGGLARIFSVATLRAVAGGAAGLTVLVAVAACAAGPLVALLRDGTAIDEPGRVFAAAHRLLVPLVAAAAAVAATGWLATRARFERRIRMTPQEYADEARGMQADPRVRLMRQGRQPRPRGPAAEAVPAGLP